MGHGARALCPMPMSYASALMSHAHVSCLGPGWGSGDRSATLCAMTTESRDRSASTAAAEAIRDVAERVRGNIGRVIVGHADVIDLVLVALLSDGHILIEDVPGIGKTTLAKAIARSIGCSFKRIQFTPDVMPSDITGINFYNQKQGEFEFRPGPIIANIVL